VDALDARTVLNPNGNKQESKRLFDAPKNVFQQPASFTVSQIGFLATWTSRQSSGDVAG
jgi:hypothetical protein